MRHEIRTVFFRAEDIEVGDIIKTKNRWAELEWQKVYDVKRLGSSYTINDRSFKELDLIEVQVEVKVHKNWAEV